MVVAGGELVKGALVDKGGPDEEITVALVVAGVVVPLPAVVVAVVVVAIVVDVAIVPMIGSQTPGTHFICAATGKRGRIPAGAQNPAPPSKPLYAARFSDTLTASSG